MITIRVAVLFLLFRLYTIQTGLRNSRLSLNSDYKKRPPRNVLIINLYTLKITRVVYFFFTQTFSP